MHQELDLDVSEFIQVPVFFDSTGTGAVALSANMVNGLVIGKRLIVPKHSGPYYINDLGLSVDAFEEDPKESLNARGITLRNIDDWFVYHLGHGEVHCGTNVIREVPAEKWWKNAPQPP